MRTKRLVQILVLSISALLIGCTTEWPTATATAAPSVTVELISSPKTSDLNVEFSRYRETNGDLHSLTLYICFDLPEKEKWILDDIILKTGDKEISTMLQVLDTNDDGKNCQGLMFSRDSISTYGEAELSIGRVRTYFSEEKRNCDKAQIKLDQTNSGVTIKCDLDWSGMVSDFEILEKPQNISEEDARERVHDAFLYEIKVDWKFLFLIKKP
jgi:hypothetical protein